MVLCSNMKESTNFVLGRIYLQQNLFTRNELFDALPFQYGSIIYDFGMVKFQVMNFVKIYWRLRIMKY
jgi:hypothetical protein